MVSGWWSVVGGQWLVDGGWLFAFGLRRSTRHADSAPGTWHSALATRLGDFGGFVLTGSVFNDAEHRAAEQRLRCQPRAQARGGRRKKLPWPRSGPPALRNTGIARARPENRLAAPRPVGIHRRTTPVLRPGLTPQPALRASISCERRDIARLRGSIGHRGRI